MGKATENLARVTRIGLDLAKTVFQVHGVGSQGEVVTARKLRRGTMLEFFGRLAPCVVAMEACSSAHHWGRELAAWSRGETDPAGACEAVRCAPTARIASGGRIHPESCRLIW